MNDIFLITFVQQPASVMIGQLRYQELLEDSELPPNVHILGLDGDVLRVGYGWEHQGGEALPEIVYRGVKYTRSMIDAMTGDEALQGSLCSVRLYERVES